MFYSNMKNTDLKHGNIYTHGHCPLDRNWCHLHAGRCYKYYNEYYPSKSFTCSDHTCGLVITHGIYQSRYDAAMQISMTTRSQTSLLCKPTSLTIPTPRCPLWSPLFELAWRIVRAGDLWGRPCWCEHSGFQQFLSVHLFPSIGSKGVDQHLDVAWISFKTALTLF